MLARNLRLIVLALFGFALVAWSMVACGEPTCADGQVLFEGKCVGNEGGPLELTKEQVAEPAVELTVAEEPPVSKEEEPAIYEPVVETKNEPTLEATTPDEPSAVDASEPVVELVPEDGPEPEPVPEPTPEPSGPVPTVSITSPKDNDIIKNASVEIEIDAKVAAGSQIDRVELYIDGKKWSDAQQTPYRFSIAKGRLTDGPHTFKAIAVTTGFQQATDEIKVTTAATGPTVTFMKPTESASVTGPFAIVVEVKSALKLKADGVVLKIDGKVVKWDKTTPNYEVMFDPKDIAFDSFPIIVTAVDQYDIQSTKQVVVVHDPKPGPKKIGEECDSKDVLKGCIAGLSCLNITGKSLCYTNCDTSVKTNPCKVVNCESHQCQPSHMGTKRGVCFPTGAAPGCLHYECTTTQRCNAGMICVGAGTTAGTRRWCMANCTPGSVLLGCKGRGFRCVPVTGGGVCVEICRQPCKKDLDCGDNQTCTKGVCGGPFCQKYSAPCRSVQSGTTTFNACI